MTFVLRIFKTLLIAGIFFLASNQMLSQAPTQLAPINNADCLSNTGIIFNWTNVNGINTYLLEISLNSDLSSPIITSPALTNSDTIDVPALGTKYYWKVSAVSGLNKNSSPIWSFTTVKNPPTLSLPTNGNTCILKTTTFKWQNVAGSTYNLQVSTASDFATTVVNQTGITSDSAVVTLPGYNTLYYWRVRMFYSTCTTSFSSAYTFTTQQAPPAHTTPANNASYIHKSGIRLSWSANGTPSSYTVQVATDSVFNAIYYEGITTSTTDSVSNLIGNTKYYWRMRADYSGCMSPWSGFRKFTTEYDQVINLIPRQDSSCVPLTARMRWDPLSGGAQGYRVQIAEDTAFTKLIFDSSNVAVNYVDVTFPKGQQIYYWHVKAKDAINEGDYSNTSWLTTATKFGARLSPDNGEGNLPISVIFKWKKSDTLSYERIQVAEDSLFAKIIFDVRNVAKDSVVLKMPNFFKKYYWRMNSLIFICTSSWSDVWSFSTVLLAPVLTYPDNNADKLSMGFTCEWKSVEGAQSYEFLLATDYSFKNVVIGKTGIPGTSIGVKDLLPSTTYYWKVRSINTEGISAWSQIFTFKTSAKALNVPALESPLNNTEHQPVNKVNLVWDKVFDANKYHLMIATTKDFKTPLVNIADYTDTSYSFTGLNYNTLYYWKVQAIKDINDTSFSAWSSTWAFTTVIQIPTDLPVLVKPEDKKDGTPIDISFEWDQVARAEVYEFQLSTEENMSKLELNDTLVISNSRYLSGLKNLTTYYWRVRAKNFSGTGPWSETRSFTTIINSVDDQIIEKYNASISPNPTNADAIISFNLKVYSNVRISLYSSDGAIIRDLSNTSYEAGLQQYNIDTKTMPNGYYFVKLTINKESMVLKLIVTK